LHAKDNGKQMMQTPEIPVTTTAAIATITSFNKAFLTHVWVETHQESGINIKRGQSSCPEGLCHNKDHQPSPIRFPANTGEK